MFFIEESYRVATETQRHREKKKKVINPGRFRPAELFVCLFLLSAFHAYGENINNDFDLKAVYSRDPQSIAVTIAPKPDRQITGLPDGKPFLAVSAEGIVFENTAGEPASILRTEYVTESKPEIFVFTIKNTDAEKPPAEIKLHIAMTYIPCIISSGLCKFPTTVERDILLKTGGSPITLPMINTIILGGLFILALAGLVCFIRFRKEFFFTGMFIIIFSGMLFYSFADGDDVLSGSALSQADKSLAIARTLCTSCIGLEIVVKAPAIDREKTRFYASLENTVLITVFSAPWCGSCPAAKAYVGDLCALYPDTLSFEIVDISLAAGIGKMKLYAAAYPLADPIPLPAIIVSNNTDEVIYGTSGLEENLLNLIKRKSHGSIPKL